MNVASGAGPSLSEEEIFDQALMLFVLASFTWSEDPITRQSSWMEERMLIEYLMTLRLLIHLTPEEHRQVLDKIKEVRPERKRLPSDSSSA